MSAKKRGNVNTMRRLLVQTQLSNYDANGNFILECDSGWQMVMGRVREMLRLNSDLHVTVMCPNTGGDGRKRQLITDPHDVNYDMWEKHGPDGDNRLEFFEHEIIPNAIATRYDFDWTSLAIGLNLGMQKIGQAPKWDAVYINDPMHLRNFKAMFHIVGGYQPGFYVHSHFIDNPSCPKFPKETSLWLGQCEAAIRADHNFWQCESSMNTFFEELKSFYVDDVVKYVSEKSSPWDDGYSRDEITSPIDFSNVRFDPQIFAKWKQEGKFIVFVPNRIGGRGRSSDYTNCGKFMFDILPEIRKRRGDSFIVLAGNPSQKFSNAELETECGPNGYVSLVPDAFNRDEFKLVALNSDVAVGLYDQDTYGGTVARECIELGCLPLWIDNFEYTTIAKQAEYSRYLAKADFSDIVFAFDDVFSLKKHMPDKAAAALARLQNVVRERCSYESTTERAMKLMKLL